MGPLADGMNKEDGEELTLRKAIRSALDYGSHVIETSRVS